MLRFFFSPEFLRYYSKLFMNNYQEMRNERCNFLKIASQHYATFKITAQFAICNALIQTAFVLISYVLWVSVLKFIKNIQHL